MATRKSKPKAKAVAKKAVAVEAYTGWSKGGQFVLLSDLHAHNWSAFAKGDGEGNSRLRRSIQVLRDSLSKARALGVPWVFAGDIVHTAGYTFNVVMAELTDALLEFPDVTKVAVWGNHDARGVGGKIKFSQTVLATLSRVVPNFTVLDPELSGGAHVDVASGLTFSGAGYQPRADLLEYGAPSDIGVYHQTIKGTRAPNGTVLDEGVDAAELLKRHRVVVVGHVHHWQYQGVKAGSPDQMLLIPGSPEHHNFGDMGEHGWWVITIPPSGEVHALMVPGGSPEFRTVDTPRDVKNDGHYYRVRSASAGDVLPDGVHALAPTPTMIPRRDTLQGARGEAILSAWIKSKPPEGMKVAQVMEAGRQLLQADEVGNMRPLRVTNVYLRNFGSYAEQAIPFNPGTWLVIGKGRDFPSNGAGKSTMFEALYWALFGRTTKGQSGDEVIRWGTEECAVQVDLTSPDGTEWVRIVRSRGAKGELVVETQDGMMEAKSTNELTDKLVAYLGITPALYQALGYFSQERLLLFASSTDGERKDMLADLIGLSAYQDAAEAARREVSALEVKETKTQAVKSTTAALLVDEQARLEAIKLRTAQWEDEHAERMRVAAEALNSHVGTADMWVQEHAEAEAESMSRDIVKREQVKENELARAQAALDTAQQATTNTDAELKKVQTAHEKVVAEVQRLRGEIQGLNTQSAAVQKRRAVQEKALAAGKCPSCDQEITPEHREKCLAPIAQELHDIEVSLADLTMQQSEAVAEAIKTQKKLDAVKKGVEAARVVVQRQQAVEMINQALSSIARELDSVQEATLKTAQAAEQATHTRLQKEYDRIKAEKNPHAGEEQGTSDRITKAESAMIKLDAELELVRMNIAVHEYWQHGFSKQGIQSLLVDEVAGLFNDERGMIFPALTQGVYDVQFSTVSQTKAGEWREKTEFQIYQRGEVIPYSSLSGGQRRRVDVGVMLTLVKAVSRWMQVPGMLGVLVLDEVFGFLDGSGAEGLMEALREVQEQVPTVFVVSHEAQLQALFPECIVVEQDQDGISRLVQEAVSA